MIGSHDTFTYLKPINPIWYLFKRWWKCQCKSLREQYNYGIRFFDIRVVRHKNEWYFAHGLVTFKGRHYNSINDICDLMETCYPEAIYRIVLERGFEESKKLFKQEIDKVSNRYKNLWRADIKSSEKWFGAVYNANNTFYNRGYKFAKVNTWELPSHELHGYITIDNCDKMNLKKEAKKINSNLDFFKDKSKLNQMIDSKEELYFLDYCTNEY